MDTQTYCVRRIRHNGRETIIARGLHTLAEALEAAIRLTGLAHEHDEGSVEFCVEPE